MYWYITYKVMFLFYKKTSLYDKPIINAPVFNCFLAFFRGFNHIFFIWGDKVTHINLLLNHLCHQFSDELKEFVDADDFTR